jgi:hypothetical protein
VPQEIVLEALRDQLAWIGFAQWLVFFPLVAGCQALLAPRAGLIGTGMGLLLLLALLGPLILLLPLYLFDEFPLPGGVRSARYVAGCIAGGLLAVPIRQRLVSHFQRR